MECSDHSRIGGFILAAGEGRRLRPATFVKPKALVPFCGTSLLELALSRLAGLAPAGVVVNACYLADQVAAAAEELGPRYRCSVKVSREEHLLNTGGGLRAGLRLLPASVQHVVVHNVDVLLDADFERLLEFHLQNRALATLLLVPGMGPRTVDLAFDQRIKDLRRPRGAGTYTYSGVHVFDRAVLDYLPDLEACSVVDAWEAAMAAERPILGLPVEGVFWVDLGTPRSYIGAHAEVADCGLRHHALLRRAQETQARRRAALEQVGVRCSGALGIGVNVRVAPGVHLHNAVLWDGTELTRRVLYADTVFTGGRAATPPPVDEKRRPDPRVYSCLDIDPETCRFEPLRKQGSGRRYARLTASDGTSRVWCAYNHERQENAGFAAIADFLDRLGVRVPGVELHLGDVGEVVLSDLGGRDLLHVTDPERIEYFLRQVVVQIARLHVLGDRAVRLEEFPLQRGFTKGLYDWERDYFRTHILGELLHRPELWAPVAAEYRRLRTRLLSQPLVPIHRDLQGANIMIAADQAYLIDFQGMRLGCAAYDLGALLYDPYMRHPIDRRRRAWRTYTRAVAELGVTPPADDLLYTAGIQRLFQALGAYGKLWRTDGLKWYRQFVAPGLDMLAAAGRESGEFPAIVELAETCRVLVDEALASSQP
ncbi:MAG: phosphotransferase [Kiritimatiellaeota bacterium]|nr:phosphotransferase [Kiritimatiellota bacterium]